MVKCSDGFEIARCDMMIRGTGDVGLKCDSQHGAYSTIIKNIKVSLQDIEDTIEYIEELNQENANIKKVA
jgi:RecG-like helicase